MSTAAAEPQEWTQLPTCADVRRRIRDRLGDASAVVDDVIAVWRACGCRGVGRERVEALVASLEGDDAELLDLAERPSRRRGVDFNEVFYADQLRDRCIEVVDGGRAFVVGGGSRVTVDVEDEGSSKGLSLTAQLRLAMAHIEFLREVKTKLEDGKARLERTLKELKTRQDRALRRIADILLVIEEAALREEEEEEEAEIDLGQLLSSVVAELREEEEEIEEKIRDALPVTKFARKSKKVSNVLRCVCGAEERSASAFFGHLRGCSFDTDLVICEICLLAVSKASSDGHRRLHESTMRLSEPAECPECGEGVARLDLLNAHFASRHEESLCCLQCKKVLRPAASLVAHWKRRHRTGCFSHLDLTLTPVARRRIHADLCNICSWTSAFELPSVVPNDKKLSSISLYALARGCIAGFYWDLAQPCLFNCRLRLSLGQIFY